MALSVRISLPFACLLTLAACEGVGSGDDELGSEESESGETQGEGGDDEGGDDESGDDQGETGLTLAGVHWRLGWEGQAQGAGAGSWETSNELGYEITVDGAWLGTWGASLVECEAQANALGDPAGSAALGEAPTPELASPWLIVEGHPGESDPSGVLFDRVEAFGHESESEALALEPTAYCNAHFVFAAISEGSEGFAEAEASLVALAPEQTLVGASLLIVGRYVAPEGSVAIPFVLRSEDAYGRLVPLEFGEVEGVGDDALALEVELRRGLEGLFEGVDFAASEQGETFGWTAIGNLARATRIIAG